jgi:Zn-dependent protease
MPIELSLDDLTSDAEHALAAATRQAARRGAAEIGTIDLLLGVLADQENLAATALTRLKIGLPQLIEQGKQALPPPQNKLEIKPKLSPEAQQVFRAGFKEASHLGDRRVDALHLLHGLLHHPEDPAYKLLTMLGVSLYDLRTLALSQPRRFRVRQRDSLQANLRLSPVFLGLVALFLGSGAYLWYGPPQPLVGICTMLFVISGWTTGLCIHEFGHAIIAFWAGDTAVGQAGYLTLNPLRYSHPLLSIVFPLLILLSGGLALPGGAVYLRPGAMRSWRWELFSSAGGPIGTLLFAGLISTVFWGDGWFLTLTDHFYFWPALALLAFLQVQSLLFNLLPIPPLDGFHMIAHALPIGLRQQMYAFSNLGFFLIFMLFRQSNPLTQAFWHTAFALAQLFHIPLELIPLGFQQFTWWQG